MDLWMEQKQVAEIIGTDKCTLGERIAKERQKLGLSQKKLACKIGVDPCTIRSWEKGKHKPT
jgi:DNA-binding XRE family transcriptional regulator